MSGDDVVGFERDAMFALSSKESVDLQGRLAPLKYFNDQQAAMRAKGKTCDHQTIGVGERMAPHLARRLGHNVVIFKVPPKERAAVRKAFLDIFIEKRKEAKNHRATVAQTAGIMKRFEAYLEH